MKGIEIESCDDCPHAYKPKKVDFDTSEKYNYFHCRINDYKIIAKYVESGTRIDYIPEWCKLEEKA